MGLIITSFIFVMTILGMIVETIEMNKDLGQYDFDTNPYNERLSKQYHKMYESSKDDIPLFTNDRCVKRYKRFYKLIVETKFLVEAYADREHLLYHKDEDVLKRRLKELDIITNDRNILNELKNNPNCYGVKHMLHVAHKKPKPQHHGGGSKGDSDAEVVAGLAVLHSSGVLH